MKKPTKVRKPAKATKKQPVPKPAEGNHFQDLPPGHWVAMDLARKRVFAIADTCAEIMAKVEELGEKDVWVGRTPGIHPAVAKRPYKLLKEESPNILDDVKWMFENSDQWLDTPNTTLGMKKPRELIGTDQEWIVRDRLRAIRYGGLA